MSTLWVTLYRPALETQEEALLPVAALPLHFLTKYFQYFNKDGVQNILLLDSFI